MSGCLIKYKPTANQNKTNEAKELRANRDFSSQTWAASHEALSL